jgi:hypothetical protein
LQEVKEKIVTKLNLFDFKTAATNSTNMANEV